MLKEFYSLRSSEKLFAGALCSLAAAVVIFYRYAPQKSLNS